MEGHRDRERGSARGRSSAVVIALPVALLLAVMLVPAGAGASGGPERALNFVEQPQDAVVDDDDRAELEEVEVEVLRDDERQTSGNVQVGIRLVGPDGGPAQGVSLEGTLSQRTEDGVATFDDLEVHVEDEFDYAYRLVAESERGPRHTPATSDPFTIWQHGAECNNDSCAIEGSGDDLDVGVEADAQQDGSMFLSVLDAATLDCGDEHRHAPNTVLFDAVDVEGTRVATMTIDRAEVHREPDNGAAHYQVCYLGDESFDDRDGEPTKENEDFAGEFYGPALLPDCEPLSQDPEGPCVVSRTKISGGHVEVQVLLPANDPMFR